MRNTYMGRLGLFQKSVLFLLVPCYLVLGVLVYFYYRDLREAITQQYLEDALNGVSVIQGNIRTTDLITQTSDINRILQEVIRIHPNFLKINIYLALDGAMKTVASTNPDEIGRSEHSVNVTSLLSGETLVMEGHSGTEGHAVIETIVPYRDRQQGNRVAAIGVYISTAPRDVLLARLFKKVLWVFVVPGMLVLMVVVFYGVHQVFLLPIQVLAKGTHALARGDLARRLDIRGRDELSHLTASFNLMASALESMVEEQRLAQARLRQANEGLARRETVLHKVLADLRVSNHELRETQLQLIQAEKMESVGRLAAGVAHEVKNPLAIILMGTHYLSRHAAGANGESAQILQEIGDAAKRADVIIRGLLDFSAPQELDLELEDLHAIVNHASALVRHELEKHHIALVNTLAEDLPSLRLDQRKIEQVLINIFMNAIQAMPDGGTLFIHTYTKQVTAIGPMVGNRRTDRLSPGAKAIIVEVEDTGTGIPDKILSRIFDPFFTSKPVGEGTGLGLAVSKNIMELHDGAIEVSNRTEGGTRVTLMFDASGGHDDGKETDLDH